MVKDMEETQDFSREISSELDQLISLSELLREMPVDAPGFRDGFFLGLAAIIAGSADRINEMLEPTYDDSYEKGKSWTFNEISGLTKGQRLFRLPEKSLLREKENWRLFEEKIKNFVQEKEENPQEITIWNNGLEAFIKGFWDLFERNEVTFDSLIADNASASPSISRGSFLCGRGIYTAPE